jgi:predicted transcriptional regulator
MKLKTITVHTRVVKAGMTVREVFEACTRANTPGLPVCDDHDRVTGRVTLKHILKRFCLPDYLVEMAPILGEQISHVQDMDTFAQQLLECRIDAYIQHPHASITSASSAVKALALMEKIDSSYLFVIDEGRYQGVVTIQSLIEIILNNDK